MSDFLKAVRLKSRFAPVHPSIPQGERSPEPLNFLLPFMKRYRTMNGKVVLLFVARCRTALLEMLHVESFALWFF